MRIWIPFLFQVNLKNIGYLCLHTSLQQFSISHNIYSIKAMSSYVVKEGGKNGERPRFLDDQSFANAGLVSNRKLSLRVFRFGTKLVQMSDFSTYLARLFPKKVLDTRYSKKFLLSNSLERLLNISLEFSFSSVACYWVTWPLHAKRQSQSFQKHLREISQSFSWFLGYCLPIQRFELLHFKCCFIM